MSRPWLSRKRRMDGIWEVLLLVTKLQKLKPDSAAPLNLTRLFRVFQLWKAASDADAAESSICVLLSLKTITNTVKTKTISLKDVLKLHKVEKSCVILCRFVTVTVPFHITHSQLICCIMKISIIAALIRKNQIMLSNIFPCYSGNHPVKPLFPVFCCLLWNLRLRGAEECGKHSSKQSWESACSSLNQPHPASL